MLLEVVSIGNGALCFELSDWLLFTFSVSGGLLWLLGMLAA